MKSARETGEAIGALLIESYGPASTREIIEVVRKCVQTVRQREAAEKNSPWTAERKAAFSKCWLRGDDAKSMAAQFGVSTTQVYRKAEAFGLPRRQSGGRRENAGRPKASDGGATRPPRASRFNPTFHAKPSNGHDTDELVSDFIKKNGAPKVYEPGASNDRFALEVYLREHGHHVVNIKETRRGWRLRVDGKTLQRDDVIALVNRHRGHEGKQPL